MEYRRPFERLLVPLVAAEIVELIGHAISACVIVRVPAIGLRRQGSLYAVDRLCHTTMIICMTMLSFRVEETDALAVATWATALGVDRSELLREALRRQIARLASEHDADIWEQSPLDSGEASLADIADWGPADDWSDWV